MGMTDVFDEYGNYKYPDYSNSQYTHNVSTTGGAMMGLTIDEAIKQLETYTIPCGKYKVAYDLAVETLHKYQKVKEVVNNWHHDIEAKDFDCMAEIADVVEDGNDDN